MPLTRHTGRLALGGLLASLLAGLLVLGGCQSNEGGRDTAAAPVHLSVWFHSGQPSERATLQAQVARFNAAQHQVAVGLTMLPEGSYNAQVQAAALANKLPDLLEFDGPFVSNYAWRGELTPLEHLLGPRLRADLLPSILAQGTYAGHLYAVGSYDSGLGLWADRRKLQRAGVRIPKSPATAWSAAEFARVLRRLAAHDPDGAVLDLKLNYRGEWFTYAFAPVLWSAGAALIGRDGKPHSVGVLDSPAAVRAMSQVQSWITHGYVDPNLDDAAFIRGRVALSWVGHWEYPRYHKALGDNLVLLPLPDFGRGSRTDQGSWAWGITRRCRHPMAAARFLRFLLRPTQVLAMTAANGAVPATLTAIARSPLYRAGGPLHLFVEQLQTIARPRPRTPAYPVITSAFQQAFAAIRDGGNVRAALHRAAQTIDQDLRDNAYYPPHPGD